MENVLHLYGYFHLAWLICLIPSIFISCSFPLMSPEKQCSVYIYIYFLLKNSCCLLLIIHAHLYLLFYHSSISLTSGTRENVKHSLRFVWRWKGDRSLLQLGKTDCVSVVSVDVGTDSAAGSVARLWSRWPFTGSSSSWCSSTLSPSPPSTTTSQTGWLKFRVSVLLLYIPLAVTHSLLREFWQYSFKKYFLFVRCSQQSSAGVVHSGDAGEDVQLGLAGVLCVPV